MDQEFQGVKYSQTFVDVINGGPTNWIGSIIWQRVRKILERYTATVNVNDIALGFHIWKKFSVSQNRKLFYKKSMIGGGASINDVGAQGEKGGQWKSGNITDKLRDHVFDKGVQISEIFVDVIGGSPLKSPGELSNQCSIGQLISQRALVRQEIAFLAMKGRSSSLVVIN